MTLKLLICALPLILAPVLRAQDEGIPEDTAIVATGSGLEYSILMAGEAKGARPAMGDTVKVHYTGWLPDGTVFDSSHRRGKPAEFKLGAVIEGWNEGLQLMSKGATFKFHIPAALGYGPRGSGQIPPNADLIFKVELLDITPGPKLPEFKKPEAQALKARESGLKYEQRAPGTGEVPRAGSLVVFKYACWTHDGKLLTCTELNNERPMCGTSTQPWNLPFLREVMELATSSGKIMFEVPPALSWPAKQRPPSVSAEEPTYWEIRYERVVPFAVPAGESVKKTESGLQYQVLKVGNGKHPESASAGVVVHYAGWLTDGTCFDNSFQRGQPMPMQLNGVIAGWTEGVQLMKEGAVFRFLIPADLAYGEAGAGVIPANADLVFVIELIEVQ